MNQTVDVKLNAENINDVISKIEESGENFMMVNPKENSDEYVNFYFVGVFEGKKVIYDTVMYTLRLHHNSELYEIAEHKAAKRFPQFKKINYEEDENGDLKLLDDNEEEIGLYMAEIIMELEEEGGVKVKEHADVDVNLDFGIGLDVGLNVEEITGETISSFIQKYNDDTLNLDETLYSYETEDDLE
jgi:hypothetical protein